MTVFVVMRFDPMQCGACGNGNLDKIFTNEEDAEAYISSNRKPGVSWQIEKRPLEKHAAAKHAVAA